MALSAWWMDKWMSQWEKSIQTLKWPFYLFFSQRKLPSMSAELCKRRDCCTLGWQTWILNSVTRYMPHCFWWNFFHLSPFVLLSETSQKRPQSHSLSPSGSVDTRGRCAWISARNLEVRQGNRKITKKELVRWISWQLQTFLLLRAEKEQLHEKLKQGQKVEEVDDSGFYAGTSSVSVHPVLSMVL